METQTRGTRNATATSGRKTTIRLDTLQRQNLQDRTRELAVILRTDLHAYNVIQGVIGIVFDVNPTDPKSRAVMTELTKVRGN